MNDSKARLEVFANVSTDLCQLRAQLDTTVSSEAQAQDSKVETIGKFVRAETRLVSLVRDLALRGTRCTLRKTKAASLRADVQLLGRQLGCARTTTERIQGSLLSLIASVGEYISKEFEEAKIRAEKSFATALEFRLQCVKDVSGTKQYRTSHSEPMTGLFPASTLS